MPTYEYKCQKCDKTFEKFQSISEETLKTCIYCDGEVSRVFHPVGIVFKGSGFYSTDNRKSEAGSKKSEVKPKKQSQPKNKETTSCDSCPSAAGCN